MTQTQRFKPYFNKWLEDLNVLLEICQRIQPFLKKWLEELFFSKISIKMKKLFWWLKELNFFFWIWIEKLNFFEHSNFFENMLKELFFFEYHSQNWTYFSALLKEWNIWEYDSKNWTSFEITHDTKKLNFLWNKIWPKELNFFSDKTQRIDFFFWREELNPFFSDRTQRIEPFLDESKTWELSFEHDPMHWTFLWLALEHVSMIWAFFDMTQSIDFFLLKEINPFSRIWLEPFLHDSKIWEPFFYMTQRLQPFVHDSMNWTFLWTFLWTWLNEMSLFLHDSKNWTFFSWIWLKELNFWTTRIEPFIEYDARNWTFSGIWLNGFFLKN